MSDIALPPLKELGEKVRKEQAIENQIKQEENNVPELLKTQTSTTIKLPTATLAAWILIQKACTVMNVDMNNLNAGSPEHQFILVWALQNQKDRTKLNLSKEELETEIWNLANSIHFSLIPDYVTAILEALQSPKVVSKKKPISKKKK